VTSVSYQRSSAINIFNLNCHPRDFGLSAVWLMVR